MAESEIPRDIGRAAVELWQRCLDERDADHVEIIAQALLAERERAARIAETWKSLLRPGTEMRLMGHREAARDIAAAIRDNPNET